MFLSTSSTSSAARTALIYITGGALLLIWTGVWYAYLRNNPPEGQAPFYFCAGFGITGLTLMIIGFGMGRIGHAARQADLPAAAVARPAVSEVPAAPVEVMRTEPPADANGAVAAPVVGVSRPAAVVHSRR